MASASLRTFRKALPWLFVGAMLLLLLFSSSRSQHDAQLSAPLIKDAPNVDLACDCTSQVANAVVALLQSPTPQATPASTLEPQTPLTAATALQFLRTAVDQLPSSAVAGGATSPTAVPDGTAHDARVSKAFDAYVALHARIMAHGGDPSEKRFLAWNVRTLHGTGLGNRILGAMSTLALAIATDRAFILGDDDILGPLLRPAPGGINWGWGEAVAAYSSAHGGAAPGVHHLLHGMEILDWSGCDDLRVTHVQHAMLTIETSQYFYPEISHNPHYREKLRAILGDGFAFFRHAMRRFVVLAPNIASALDSAESDMFYGPATTQGAPRRRRHVIGMQIRVGHLVRAAHEEQVFYKCAAALAAAAVEHDRPSRGQVGHGVVTSGAYADVSADQRAAALAAIAEVERLLASTAAAGNGKVGHEGDSSSPDVYYFLATDNGDVRSRARSVFGDRLLTYSGDNGAVIDTFLLSRCDDTIITWSRSTFGSVGASLSRSGLPPYAVMSGAKRGSECVRLMSTEPCFHGAFADAVLQIGAHDGIPASTYTYTAFGSSSVLLNFAAWFDRWKLKC